MLRRRGGALERLLHDGEVPVRVRVWQPVARGRALRGPPESRAGAEYGVARMRFALGLDDDLRPFLRAFARDRLIGPSLRRRPWLRAPRRPQPFEALAFAICEQLIEYERAAAIQRRLVARLGRRWPHGDDGALRDLPETEVLARTSPALLQSLDLGGSRARALGAGGPRGRRRARRPGRQQRGRGGTLVAAPAGDPRDRTVDGGGAGADRAGPPRPGARRRPRAAQAGGPAAERRGPEGGGRGSARCASCSPPTARGPAWRPPT